MILEYMAAPDGLGRVMKVAISYVAVDLLIVAVLWCLLLGFAIDAIANMLGRKIA